MKKIYSGLVLTAYMMCLTLSSCQENELLTNNSSLTSSTITDTEVLRTEFSKAVAQSLTEQQVRQFIKSESLKEFDGDNDILYAFVKDKVLEDGRTFEAVLMKYAPTLNFKQLVKQLPVLTIFVPTLESFSPQTWNINSQIPIVAIDNSHLGNKLSHLTAYTFKLERQELDAKKAPAVPVIVIKENERVVSKSKSEPKAKKDQTIFEEKSTKVIKENEEHTFYFIGDVDPKVDKGLRTYANRPVPSHLQFYQYHKSGYPNEPGTQRDWLYYHIWPKFNALELTGPNINGGVNIDWSKGTLGGTYYTEKLTKFKFNQVVGVQQVSETWTEGVLEFHVVLSFVHRTSGATNDLKVFYCTANNLRSGTTTLEYDPNVEFMVWDANRYGDEWKLSFLEHDNSTTVTTTSTTKSTFGANFEGNAGWEFIVKLGVKFNGSATIEKSGTTSVSVSSGSDQLGDIRFTYDMPILTSGETRYSMGNGAITVSIEPVEKMTDNRITPYID